MKLIQFSYQLDVRVTMTLRDFQVLNHAIALHPDASIRRLAKPGGFMFDIATDFTGPVVRRELTVNQLDALDKVARESPGVPEDIRASIDLVLREAMAEYEIRNRREYQRGWSL